MNERTSDELALFARVPIFQGLSDIQLRNLVDAATARRYAPGEPIIREGEEGDSIFILTSGSVEITKTMTLVARQDVSNVEKTLVRLEGSEPAFFGEMGMLEKAERSATVTAATLCIVYEISRAEFDRLADQDPRLGYVVVSNVARVVCSRLRKANKDTLKLATALSIALGNR